MKSLLKNLGLLLVMIGAVILIIGYYGGNVNDNAIWATSLVLIIVGLISHIVLNKRIAD